MNVLISKNPRTPRQAFAGLESGTTILGLTNGAWSFIDAIKELVLICGPSHITLSTWTAANADTLQAERLLASKKILSWKLLVDRSFQTRQPKYCNLVRSVFGDDSVRVWNSHAKFCLVKGEDLEVLYLTSANLNQNKRIENFSIYTDSNVVRDYQELVDKLFAMQKPAEGFNNPKMGRIHTDKLL